MAEEEQTGWPVYLDPLDRGVVDAAADEFQPNEWHPRNRPAVRLCKCLEGLRDLDDVLENLFEANAKTKRRRRLRRVFVPLHSLCVGIVELLDVIQSEKAIHDRLPSGCTAEITALRSTFVTTVPFDRKGRLGELRNKVSAHYEKNLSPEQMRQLLLSVEFTEVGEWINVCLAVLCDALKLDAYEWMADRPTPDTTVLMCQEPLMTVLSLTQNTITGLEGFYMRKQSPRTSIYDVIQKLAANADRLFERDSQYRIRGFVGREKGESWARLLSTLPKP